MEIFSCIWCKILYWISYHSVKSWTQPLGGGDNRYDSVGVMIHFHHKGFTLLDKDNDGSKYLGYQASQSFLGRKNQRFSLLDKIQIICADYNTFFDFFDNLLQCT
eukprot:106312_1